MDMYDIMVEKKKEFSKRVATDYENGKSIKAIMSDYADEYREIFSSELRAGKLHRLITLNCSQEFLTEHNAKLTEKAEEYKKQGLTIIEIADLLGYSTGKVSQLLSKPNVGWKANRHDGECIRPEEINYLKQNVNEGDAIRMMVRTYYLDSDCRERCVMRREFVRIKRKFPNIVETSAGTMSWGQMAAFIRAERRAECES